MKKYDLFIFREGIPNHSDIFMKIVSFSKLKSFFDCFVDGSNLTHNSIKKSSYLFHEIKSKEEVHEYNFVFVICLYSYNNCTHVSTCEENLFYPWKLLRY